MKIAIENLGAIRAASLDVSDLTIICGKNNTGKTYIAYALFGFLDYWHTELSIDIPNDIITAIMEKGAISVPIKDFAQNSDKILAVASQQYSKAIHSVFAGEKSFFKDSIVKVEVEKDSAYQKKEIKFKAGSVGRSLLEVRKEKGDDHLQISLLVDRNSEDLPPRSFVEDMLSAAVRDTLFTDNVPLPFIASAERTGSAIFQKELDFTRNRLIDVIGDKNSNISVAHLLGNFRGEYPIPVRRNVDFIRTLPNLINQKSFFASEHPEILNQFTDIIGGAYKVTKDGEVQFLPKDKRGIKLNLIESSSAVRSLLDIGFYIKYIAQKGDIIIVDEPELNLHPENQRKVARLFAQMVNVGVKVFVTTHSDYLIKELNTLIMLNNGGERLQEIAKRENYNSNELLSPKKVGVYIAKEDLVKLEGYSRKVRCQTLVRAPVDETGIELETFDATIDDMNRIQDEIIWGE